MSEHNKKTHDPEKPRVRDLRTEKDVKGGGLVKPQSPASGGDKTQPVPPSGT